MQKRRTGLSPQAITSNIYSEREPEVQDIQQDPKFRKYVEYLAVRRIVWKVIMEILVS